MGHVPLRRSITQTVSLEVRSKGMRWKGSSDTYGGGGENCIQEFGGKKVRERDYLEDLK
jgi:hypothetical protein